MPVAVTNPALSTLSGMLVFDLRINDEIVNLTSSEISKTEIVNAESQHESATITTQLTKPQIARFVDQPVSFRWGHKLDNNTWYGYVVAITPSRDYQVDTIVDISCVGPTWPLQNGTPRFVRNITVPEMFAAIVTGGYRQDISMGYNLGVQVDSHDYAWPALAQTGESDWEFLLSLANRIGYAVYNYRGVVRLVKPLRVLNETPVFQSYIKGDEVLDITRTLLEWEATTQSLDLRQNIKPTFGYFEGIEAATTKPKDVAILPVPGPPTLPSAALQLASPYRMVTDTPIRDRRMAEVYSESWMNRIDFWNNQAAARIYGNAQIIPGVNISVQVSGTPNGRNEYDGIWLVRMVHHVLTHNSFQTNLVLSRDETPVPRNINPKWFWNVDRGAPKVLKDNVTGKWKSSWGGSPEFINAPLEELVTIR